jgi:hypothetical protein
MASSHDWRRDADERFRRAFPRPLHERDAMRTPSSRRDNMPARMISVRPEGRFHPRMRKHDMTPPTQDQNQNRNQNQNQQKDQTQAQGRKDDMHNTGAQAKTGQQNASDSDRDVQQRKDAPKQDQDR